ncbi:ubiquitin-specific protease otu1 [Vermiconidia calcicola]|uniref:Ubiquitin-specific protease otu1 n=1 Tax=Vermiconidia calcicola TaxID=1690605 RepID=A0ACC3MKW6_9PEZI|nr:ubiquitin-specific protease otu1 [Vermiconidia calcicola]
MTGAIRIRVRGPQGVATISIESSASWQDLLSQISDKTGVKGDFDLKYGYPPQPFNTESIDSHTVLSDLPHNLNGEQLIVMPKDMNKSLSSAGSSSKPRPEAVKSLPPQGLTSPPQHNPGDFPDQPLDPTRKPKGDVESEPPEIPVPMLEGVMVLRVMPDDNSCMFRALSSAVLGSALDGMTELRSVVAQTIQANPDLYTKGMLEKEPSAYCQWIQREDSWGGGIELSILSQHFNVEICSINVQDLRIDKFNEGQQTRCVLVYSGIHYDVCAVTPFAGAEPEFDRKVFDVVKMSDEETDGGALEAARELCKVLQGRHYFTDTHGFDVKCNTCGQAGTGEQWAVQHAKTTGHSDFGEG